ncbi:histidine phosphatase family protein [Myxococcus sp. AM001]|nr:histidine phosphatase family protein [Myxococcus sp. AM001]
MSNLQWVIPPSVLTHLARAAGDRAVVVLLRHSVRDELPSGEAGYTLPITDAGRGLAHELGALLQGRLRTLHTSPLPRCVQTAEALRDGARTDLPIIADRLLGDPGAFVIDGRRAVENWERVGHDGVMRHLVTEDDALPGMARPDEAARFLVHHMLAVAGATPGIHVFVTHDLLITAAAARLLGQPLSPKDWPWYLEGAFFWREGARLCASYRDYSASQPRPLCGLTEPDVSAFALRELAATVGLNSGARCFLAGGAFKTLLTGRPPRDLDVWAPSEADRQLLLQALRERSARPLDARPFADAFEVAGRVVEIPHKVEPTTLKARVARFDIALSAIGVEHGPDGDGAVDIHPLAAESVMRKQVLLVKPLVNWKYALVTLERMRRYAAELGFASPSEEEAEVWRVFDAQPPEVQFGMAQRYSRVGTGGFGILEELVQRAPHVAASLRSPETGAPPFAKPQL